MPHPSADQCTDICARVAAGESYTSAVSAVCSVHPRTATRWRRAGERDIERGDDHTPLARMVRSIAKVEAVIASEIERSYMTRIRDEDCDWRAQAWYLERRRPNEWGPVDKAKRVDRAVEDEVAAILDAVQPHMSPPAWRELVGAIATLTGVEATATLAIEADRPALSEGD